MRCKNCGHDMPVNSVFCPMCGIRAVNPYEGTELDDRLMSQSKSEPRPAAIPLSEAVPELYADRSAAAPETASETTAAAAPETVSETAAASPASPTAVPTALPTAETENAAKPSKQEEKSGSDLLDDILRLVSEGEKTDAQLAAMQPPPRVIKTNLDPETAKYMPDPDTITAKDWMESGYRVTEDAPGHPYYMRQQIAEAIAIRRAAEAKAEEKAREQIEEALRAQEEKFRNTKEEKGFFGEKAFILCVIVITILAGAAGAFAYMYFSLISKLM